MATPVSDLRDQLDRELNIPGFEQLPDITTTELDGYILDGFWECRLLGMLDGYTVTDGTELATPIGDNIQAASDAGGLPEQYQMLVIILAGVRMVRLKVLNLAINFKAEAGPVSFEQQASATTLRAVLKSLEERLAQLKLVYSDSLSPGAMYYFDGTLQRAMSESQSLLELQVV
jgi:hypothetical protein